MAKGRYLSSKATIFQFPIFHFRFPWSHQGKSLLGNFFHTTHIYTQVLHPMTDEELIDKCLGGDQRAQKELFDKFSRKMMSVCMRYIHDREQAEDVLQDGFVKVFTHLKSFKRQGSFEGWIRRTMVNTALDHLRKAKNLHIDADISEAEFLAGEDEKVVGKMRVEELMQLISEMPPGYRTVFNMYAIEGYSHQEIADELGVTESTSKTQYRKARNYLMNIIVERENI